MKGNETRLPCDLDAERAVLVTLLYSGERYADVAADLAVDDFSVETHRAIYSTMAELHKANEPIEVVTVASALRAKGTLFPGGTLPFLLDLQSGVPEFPHLDAYVRQIRSAATLRRIQRAAHNLMLRASEPAAEPEELLEQARSGFLKLAESLTTSTLAAPGEIIDAAGGLAKYIDRREHTTGLKTGFPGFDATTGGLRSGGLYIIGGRPRMGKTAFVLNIAERVSVDREQTTLIFSLEMNRESLVDRLICSRARVNSKKFEAGWLNQEEQRRAAKAAGEIAAGDRILIDDRSVTTTAEIHSKIRREIARRPVALVIVDYLQLLIGGSAQYRVAEASKISRDLKLIAKDCKCPVIALSQLNRDCDTRDNHEPTLADLRETGAIEQDADLVGFLYRPEVYSPEAEHLRGLADLIVAKQRSGPEGRIPLLWLREFTRFEDRTE